jgi:hypothetical protein
MRKGIQLGGELKQGREEACEVPFSFFFFSRGTTLEDTPFPTLKSL